MSTATIIWAVFCLGCGLCAVGLLEDEVKAWYARLSAGLGIGAVVFAVGYFVARIAGALVAGVAG